MNISVAVVVVTYNRKDMLARCLNSLKYQNHYISNIIVVNNGSNDGTKELLKTFDAGWSLEVVSMKSNVGGAGGFKAGIEMAKLAGYDYIWVMDDDAYAEEDCLSKLIATAIETNAACVCPLIIGSSGNPQLYHHKKIDKWMNEKAAICAADRGIFRIDANAFVGPLISAKVIDIVGLPNENFFIWYDDVEYTYRISRFGLLLLNTEAKINHQDYFSSGELSVDWKMFYGIRNKYWTAIHSKNFLIYIYVSMRIVIWFLGRLSKFKGTVSEFAASVKYFAQLMIDAHREKPSPRLFLGLGVIFKIRK